MKMKEDSKADKAMDKKKGIKEGSKADGGKFPAKKGGSKPKKKGK
jgi:hypothetical protein